MNKIFSGKRHLSAALYLALCVVMAAGLFITPAAAQAPPSWPHQFRGYAYMGSGLAPEGTEVTAKIGGNLCGTARVAAGSTYNYTIQVQSATGGAVTFFINGVQATADPVTFSSGTRTNGFDLHVGGAASVLTVTTGSAINVTETSATLRGTVTDMGGHSPVYVSFDYGKTGSYGMPTEEQTVTSTAPASFTTLLTGLTPNTTYYYRARAHGSGEAVGQQATFTTAAPASGCSSGCCHWVRGTAYLNGAKLASGNVVAFVNGSATAAATTTIASDGTYNFYVPVSSSATITFTAGGYAARETVAASCLGASTNFNLNASTPLAVTTNTPATLIGSTYATLGGTLTGLGGNPPALVYFDYGLSQTSYTQTIPQESRDAIGAFTKTVPGLTANTPYWFRANVVGGTAGSWVTFTTTPLTLSVATVAASGVGPTSATIAGNLLDMGGINPVTVYFKWGQTSPTTPTANQTMTGTGYFYHTLTGLSPATTYFFQAYANTTGAPSILSFKTSIAPPSGCPTGCCQWVKGTAYYNSVAVNAGTVAAFVNGSTTAAATTTTNTTGGYNFYIPVSNGAVVTFKVNGVAVAQPLSTSCMGASSNYNLYTTGTGPAIGVSPTSLSFTAASPSSSPVPTSRILTISNTGTGSLVWTAEKTAAWLTITPTSGTATTTTPSTVTVTVNPTLVADNATYSDTITIRAPLASNNPQTVSATLTVGTPSGMPTIGLSATSFAFTATSPSASPVPTSSPLTISNVGSGSLVWTASKTAAWLTITPTSGTATTTTPNTMTISVSPTGLADNTTFTDTITISAPLATTPTRTVAVTLRIGSTPAPSCLSCIGSTYPALTYRPKNIAWYAPFQAGSDCIVNYIYVKSAGTGNAKAAIYSDSAGEIGSLLGGNNTLTPVSAGNCNAIHITPAVTLTAGKSYWLAYWTDTANIMGTGDLSTATVKFSGTGDTFNFDTTATNIRTNYGVCGVVAAGN